MAFHADFGATHDDDEEHPPSPAPAPGRKTLTAALAPRARRADGERDRSPSGERDRSPSGERDRSPSGARELELDRPGRLPSGIGASMGVAFGLDLANVPVVADSGEASRVGARAFASRGELHFAPGEYQPGTAVGLDLIGHEVAHLAQQVEGRTRTTAHAKGVALGDDPALEAEADELGHRAARGETALRGGGVLRTPLGSATAVQRKQTAWTDLKQKDGGGVDWKPHRFVVDASGEALGTGGNVAGIGPAPATWITYTGPGATDPAHPLIAAGGLGVEAVLGPDRPEGEASPAWTTPAALDTIAAAIAAPAPPPASYLAVQLLPEELGGSDATKNLVALPPLAAGALKHAHARVTEHVERDRIFLSYVVRVTEAKDAHPDAIAKDAPYASRVEIVWAQLKNDGTDVAAATGTIAVDVPSPSLHAGGSLVTGTANPHAKAASPGKHAEARADWTTHITWGAEHKCGDGTLMEAHRLGPDHKVGDQPTSGKNAWSDRRKALETAATDKKSYVAGHLLNHHLGGPGNDARNLAAIPIDANDLHESEVESVIKHLVNDQGAWVYYKVEVSHAKDAGAGDVDYPDAFICNWHQLDRNGEPVPGTVGAKTITMAAPSTYATTPPPPKKKEPSLATTIVTTADASGGAATAATAHTVLSFDEVLLEDSGTLGKQRDVMRPLVKALKKLGLEPQFQHNGALAADLSAAVAAFKPSVAESEAWTEVETLSPALSVLQDPTEIEGAVTVIAAIETRLTTIKATAKPRHLAASAAIRIFFHKQFAEPKAKAISDILDGFLADDVAKLTALVESIEHQIVFMRRAIAQLSAHRSGLHDVDARASKWSGGTAKPADTPAPDVAIHTWEGVQAGASSMRDAVNGIDTPMQQLTRHKVEVGGDASDSVMAARERAKRRADTELAPPPSAGALASQALADKVIALTKSDGYKWPTWTAGEAPPEVEPIAIAIHALVAALPATAGAIDVTVRSLYVTNTRAFAAYHAWLAAKLSA